jgi:DNA-binding IscR family transcriptional regulator
MHIRNSKIDKVVRSIKGSIKYMNVNTLADYESQHTRNCTTEDILNSIPKWAE